MPPRCQIVIPARLASTRLSEKLLRVAGGKSILQHTFEAASRATIAEGVTIAVDDRRLAAECESFAASWVMTSEDCPSGTDRIAEVAQSMPNIEIFVNVQGDEPEIDPATIDKVATALIENPDADMATVGTPIRDLAILEDPSCVKIVLAADQPATAGASTKGSGSHCGSGSHSGSGSIAGRAIYFSRSVVPHSREALTREILARDPPSHWHHIGLYAYRRQFLDWFSAQPPSHLETIERLEQLRAIEAGLRVVVASIDSATPGIDTLDDFQAFAKRVGG